MKHRLSLYALLWLLVGFTTGTAVLSGPLRWIARYVRERGWDEGAEQAAILPIIGMFVIGSALTALWLTRVVLFTRSGHVRIGVPALCLVAAAATLWLWMSPEMMASSLEGERVEGPTFTFGPYATEERMRDLKREGYTAIVSLLHPLVVPFETKLIATGRTAAERVGIGYINVPMLPWVSDNQAALARIEQLARDAAGQRYYVHCYLGKDRVRLVKGLVERLEGAPTVSLEPASLAFEASRRLEDGTRFERGAVVEVDTDVWLAPYPVDDEFMAYILPGTHGDVLSLLDPGSADDAAWIEKERALLEGHRRVFTLRPLPLVPFAPERALEIAREAAEMPRPLVVHAFLGVDSGHAPAAEAFLQAYRSGLPPLPPALFAEPLAAGPVRVVAPHVAIGPRPSPGELAAYLQPKGVREVVHVGQAAPESMERDRRAAAGAGLRFRSVTGEDPAFFDVLRRGGPWYLYGPDAVELEPALVAALGPALPPAAAPRAAAPPAEASFFAQLVPSPRRVILLAPVLTLLVAAAAGFAGWLREGGMPAPYTRKVFHFLIFTAAGVLHIAAGLSAVALFGTIVSCAVIYGVLRGEGFAFYEAMARPSDAPRRTLFVVVPLATTAVGGLVANLLFGPAAQIGYLVAGWGDAVAEPVGARWGRHRYRVPSIAGVPATRSLEGSAAVLLCGSLAALLGLQMAGIPAPSAIAIAAACGVAGAAVEAFSNHGLDNLTVQLAAAGTAAFLLG